MKSLLAEGWRSIPHSYAVVNQRQCLELLKREGLALRHHDLPYYLSDWRPVTGLFEPAEEAALAAIPPPGPQETFDVSLRIAYPYFVGPCKRAARSFLFATSEFMLPAAEAFSAPLSELKAGALELLTPSNWSKAGLVRFGAKPELTHVIPHGFAPEIFHPASESRRKALRKALGWEGRFVFLHIGAMTLNKGIEQMLRSFAKVSEKRPEALLALKGLDSVYQSGGMLARALRDNLTEAEAERVGPRISFIGETLRERELARLFQAADAYLSPYLAEGFNMPVLEAIACGLPPICTAGGPTDDFVDDSFALRVESSVFMFKTPDKQCLKPSPEHLEAQMERAISDEAWMAQARQKASLRASSEFTWEKSVDKLLDLVLPGFRSGV